MNRPSFHVRKGDQVLVTTGKHKGATGRVLQVIPKKLHVLVEGVRMLKKHVRRSKDSPQGAIIEREGPIHVSNVKVLLRSEQVDRSGSQSQLGVR